jgi:exodeoxyribonuclease VIII
MQNDYFSIEALSASGAKELLRSPAHYRHWKDNPKEPTAAMVFGTLVHALILEPERPIEKVVSIKQLNWTTKEGKAEREQLQKLGLPIVSQQDVDRALLVRDAVFANEEAADLLTDAVCEKSYTWTGYSARVKCKAGVDAVTPRGIVDIKTTIDASPDGFARRIRSLNYHLQAAHYIDGLSNVDGVMHNFTFIAVETFPPYAVACYQLDRNALSAGYAAMDRVAKVYADCLASGSWPAYPSRSTVLSLPHLSDMDMGSVDAEDFD